jgi:hypothetical protein
MISFSPDDLKRFLSEDDGRPIDMLNLLRFKPEGEILFRWDDEIKGHKPLIRKQRFASH